MGRALEPRLTLFKGDSVSVHATLEPDEGEYLDHTAPSLRFKDRILASFDVTSF